MGSTLRNGRGLALQMGKKSPLKALASFSIKNRTALSQSHRHLSLCVEYLWLGGCVCGGMGSREDLGSTRNRN